MVVAEPSLKLTTHILLLCILLVQYVELFIENPFVCKVSRLSIIILYSARLGNHHFLLPKSGTFEIE